MSVTIREDLPGIAEASAELDRLMADDNQSQGGGDQERAQQTADKTGESANKQGDRAAQTQERNAQGQFSKDKAGTPAAAEAEKTDGQQDETAAASKVADAGKTAEGKESSDQNKQQQQNQSRFAK